MPLTSYKSYTVDPTKVVVDFEKCPNVMILITTLLQVLDDAGTLMRNLVHVVAMDSATNAVV